MGHLSGYIRRETITALRLQAPVLTSYPQSADTSWPMPALGLQPVIRCSY